MAERVLVTIRRGDKVTLADQTDSYVFRVMAVADGYAMLRFPRAVPFVESIKNLRRITTGDEETT